MLPTNESVGNFLTGLGTDGPEVAASLEAMGARDKPGITTGYDFENTVPVTRNCVFAVALRIEFPELDTDNRWAVGSLCVRFNDQADDDDAPRLVNLPRAVRGVMTTMDTERTHLALGADLTPTYPNLMAPREEAS